MRMIQKAAFAGAAVMFLAACSDSATAPTAVSPTPAKPSFAIGDNPGAPGVAVATFGKIIVCKTGNVDGVFNVTRTTVNGGGTGGVAGNSYAVAAGTCRVVGEDDGASGIGSNFVVTESPAANLTAVSGSFIGREFPSNNIVTGNLVSPANGDSYFINSIHGILLTFNNRQATGCTFTQGYWKTHGPTAKGNNSNEWDLTSITLGNTSYTDVQALSIFNTAVKGNGLISLAHQLMAAKLNLANGVVDPSITAAITAADALIGNLVVPPVGNGYLDPAVTAALTGQLAAFNEGITGPGHCGEETGNPL